MITADQLLAHLVGDYILQSDWMANEKTKRFLPAAIHALVYSIGFLIFRPSPVAWLVICLSHFLIDRYRLARYVVWAKNFLAPIRWHGIRRVLRIGCQHSVLDMRFDARLFAYKCSACGVSIVSDGSAPEVFIEADGPQSISVNRPFRDCSDTGYPKDRPAFLSVWLLIIADNILHILINGIALKYL